MIILSFLLKQSPRCILKKTGVKNFEQVERKTPAMEPFIVKLKV